MLSTKNKGEAADSLPLLVAEVYHLAGEFRNLGNRIAGSVGQTQARWQVLSVIAEGSKTVAGIASRLGYARQSVQRTADQLAQSLLIEYRPNPEHAKSPLVEMTSQGKSALTRITGEADKWHQQLSADLKPSELSTALRVLRHLCATLEGNAASK